MPRNLLRTRLLDKEVSAPEQEIWPIKCRHPLDDSRMRREFVNQWTVEMAIMLPHTVDFCPGAKRAMRIFV